MTSPPPRVHVVRADRFNIGVKFTITLPAGAYEATAGNVSVTGALFPFENDDNGQLKDLLRASTRDDGEIEAEATAIGPPLKLHLGRCRVVNHTHRNACVLRYELDRPTEVNFLRWVRVARSLQDRYRVLSLLGIGGFGRVYRCYDLTLNRPVAIKALECSGDSKPNARERAEREAQRTAQLKSDHIVEVYDFVSTSDDYCVVMEYIGGSRLRDILDKGERMRLAHVLRVGVAIAKALGVAHGKRIIHKDLKPENVMEDQDGCVKVLDFGLAEYRYPTAAQVHGSRDPEVTHSMGGDAAVFGTHGYVAPEVQNGQEASQCSDVYSLGVMLFEMLEGVRPDLSTEWLAGDRLAFRASPSRTRRWPKYLFPIIERALAPDPKDRFQHASELEVALASVREQLGPYEHGDRFLLANRFDGKCQVCGERSAPIGLSVENKLCTNSAHLGTSYMRWWRGGFLSILPEWRSKPDIEKLPSIGSVSGVDLLAIWADSDENLPRQRWRLKQPRGVSDVAGCLPYERDFLALDAGLRCGRPTLYRAPALERTADSSTVYVLDMASYRWSHTLKDPKSWAVVNTAREMGFRHLALWTAGNAGVSLARMVREANHFLRPKQRMSVYALFNEHDRSLDAGMRAELSGWECQLIPVHSEGKRILPPEEVFTEVRKRAQGLGSSWNPAEYWDVTDGWDLVGIVMYRLLMLQVLSQVQPTHVIVPVGTGNLLIGCMAAIDDLVELQGEQVGIRLVGAIPSNENVKRIISSWDEPRTRTTPVRGRRPRKSPFMPKLAGAYTPLVPIIDAAVELRRLDLVEVDGLRQAWARNAILERAEGRPILAEPSAMATFAALPVVLDGGTSAGEERTVLVVNSGLGLQGGAEWRYRQEATKHR